jgi:DNA-binding XRE family transcriptional regulator
MAELKAWAEQAEHGAQKKLAERLGVSRQTLNSWIGGRKTPSLKAGLKMRHLCSLTQRRLSYWIARLLPTFLKAIRSCLLLTGPLF